MFQSFFKLRKFWNRMSGVLRRRYSVFIHSVNARRRTSDSRTYFIWRMTETWMFGHNNQQQNNCKLHFNCIVTTIVTTTPIFITKIFNHNNSFDHMWDFWQISSGVSCTCSRKLPEDCHKLRPKHVAALINK